MFSNVNDNVTDFIVCESDRNIFSSNKKLYWWYIKGCYMAKKKKIQMQVTFKYCKHFFLLTDDIVIVCFSIQEKAKQHSAFLSFMSALRITVLDLVSQTM